MRVTAVIASGLLLATAATAAPTAGSPGAIERALRQAARSGHVPRTLDVTYADHGGGWSDVRFRLTADGRLRRTGAGPADAPETRTVRLRRAEVVGVVRLLVRLRAWRQPLRERPRPMVIYVDEVRIRIGRATTRVTDWRYANGTSSFGPLATRLQKLFEAHR